MVDDEPAPVAEWLPALARRSARRKPLRVPRWSAGWSVGEAGDRDDDRDPRRLEREGQARAGLAARATRAGVRGSRHELRPTGRELLDELRPVAFAIAYRMLGSVAEAEDVVQEALLRVHRALDAGERIESPRAFVATVTTRLAIDELRSALARGGSATSASGCPEPIVTDGADDPARPAEMADSLSMALLVLLESLSPEQRAVLLLHDVFDYGYDEIAAIVGKSEDRPPARGRGRGATSSSAGRAFRPRASSATSSRGGSSRRFRTGDLAGLEALLAHDVVLTGDGGGKVPALARPLQGRNRVARTLRQLDQAGGPDPGSVAAAGRGQRRRRARCCSTARTTWSASGRSRSPAARSGAELDRQPGEAGPSRAGARLHLASEAQADRRVTGGHRLRAQAAAAAGLPGRGRAAHPGRGEDG